MRVVAFGEERRVGLFVNDSVIDLNRADSSLPSTLRGFIEGGAPALEKAQRVADLGTGAPNDSVRPASQVRLRAPYPGLRVACVGGNYARHLRGMGPNADPNRSLEDVAKAAREGGQWGFWKVIVDAAGPGDPILYPSRSRYFDYEGEAAIVLGKSVKDFSGSSIDDLVWGITLLNDYSIRDGGGMARPISYNLAKNFDGSTAIGPCIVVGELRYDDVPVQTRINGTLRQDYNTNEMIFTFPEVLEYLSRDFTFVPGDIISGGTCEGTAADMTRPLPDGTRPRDLFLKPGDVVEVASEKIGVLRNQVSSS